ncbi:MAG: hypothetical protein KY429_11305 [Actinobacteria bacterium]|nr:hypothetical protein [Actinomycetota bacterium]
MNRVVLSAVIVAGIIFAVTPVAAADELDAGFSGGMVWTDLGSAKEIALDVVGQEDGRVIAAGTSGGDLAVVRYNADGSLDESFGLRGAVKIDLGADDWVHKVAIQPSGAIILGTAVGRYPNSEAVLLRLTPDGREDPTFGRSGSARFPLFAASGGIRDILVTTTGELIVWQGFTGNRWWEPNLFHSPEIGPTILRFDAEGRPLQQLAISNVTGVDLQDDGKLLIAMSRGQFAEAGTLCVPFTSTCPPAHAGARTSAIGAAVVRLLPSGALDPTFGQGGVSVISRPSPTVDPQVPGVTSVLGPREVTGDVEAHPDGGIWFSVDPDGFSHEKDYRLARLTQDGLFDEALWARRISLGSAVGRMEVDGHGAINAFVWSGIYSAHVRRFSSAGDYMTSLAPSEGYFLGLGVQPDGKVLLAGTSSPYTPDDFLVARYTVASGAEPVSTLTLSASTRKDRQNTIVDLWSETGEAGLDVYRDGMIIGSTVSSPYGGGAYSDNLGRARGSFVYKVCRPASSTECSNEVRVDI